MPPTVTRVSTPSERNGGWLKRTLEYAFQAKRAVGASDTQGTLANLGFAALNPGLS